MLRRTQSAPWKLALILAGLLAVLVGFTGCGGDDDDDDDGGDVITDPLELTRMGWTAFESLDYENALDLFLRAIDNNASSSDAYSGAGWCYYLIGGNNADARSSWQDGLDKPGGINDLQAGLGFLEYYEGNYGAAIDWFMDLLDDNPNYSFIHMPSLNQDDIRITVAMCYYLEGDFGNSLQFVQSLNPLFAAEETEEGWDALGTEIERLSRIIRG